MPSIAPCYLSTVAQDIYTLEGGKEHDPTVVPPGHFTALLEDMELIGDAIFEEDKTMLAQAIGDTYIHLCTLSVVKGIDISLAVADAYEMQLKEKSAE